jgi:hypothetical protein
LKHLDRKIFILSVLVAMMHAFPATPCFSAQKSSPEKSKILYVSDFELDAQDVQTDQGPAGRSGVLHGNGPIRRATGHGTGDAAKQAQHIVKLMSDTLVSDFTKAGYNARRLPVGETPAGQGYLITGVFTEVDEGNRVRRAVIGFGAGAVTMQLYVNVADVDHPLENLYTVDNDASSGKRPGAAITMNPVAMGAKFVMEKNASDKVVKKTAAQISEAVIRRVTIGPGKTVH